MFPVQEAQVHAQWSRTSKSHVFAGRDGAHGKATRSASLSPLSIPPSFVVSNSPPSTRLTLPTSHFVTACHAFRILSNFLSMACTFLTLEVLGDSSADCTGRSVKVRGCEVPTVDPCSMPTRPRGFTSWAVAMAHRSFCAQSPRPTTNFVEMV